MKICVVGPGAIGGLLAARFTLAGETVTVKDLVAPRQAGLFVRVSPGTTAGGYDLALAPPSPGVERGDSEPNDRGEDALTLSVGTTATGEVGAWDPSDWYELDATTGQVISVNGGLV